MEQMNIPTPSEFVNNLSENDLNKLDFLLCPICNRTVPEIEIFVDPVSKVPYVSIKCEYQKNMAVVPIENLLNEYFLFEKENNTKLFPPSESNSKIIIDDKKDLSKYCHSLIHNKNVLSIDYTCQIDNHEKENEFLHSFQKRIAFCANCSKRICNKCLAIHDQLDPTHLVTYHGVEINEKCPFNHSGFIKKECQSCSSCFCENCLINKNCTNCKSEQLLTYDAKREMIKKEINFLKIKTKSEEAFKKDKESYEEIEKIINKKIEKLNNYLTIIKNEYEQHYKVNTYILALIKILYSNFTKSKKFKNFHLINNLIINTSFQSIKYKTNPIDEASIDSYTRNLKEHFETKFMIEFKYRNFYFNQKNYEKQLNVTSLLWIQEQKEIAIATKEENNKEIENHIKFYKFENNSLIPSKIIHLSVEVNNMLIYNKQYLVFSSPNADLAAYKFGGNEIVLSTNKQLNDCSLLYNDDYQIYMIGKNGFEIFTIKSNSISSQNFTQVSNCNAFCIDDSHIYFNSKSFLFSMKTKSKNIKKKTKKEQQAPDDILCLFSIEKSKIMSSDKSGFILIWNRLIKEIGFRWSEPIYNLKKVNNYIFAMIYDENEIDKIRDKGYVIVSLKNNNILVHRLNIIGTAIEEISSQFIAFGSSSSFNLYKIQEIEDSENEENVSKINIPIMIKEDNN